MAAAGAERREQMETVFDAALVPALDQLARDLPGAITALSVLCGLNPGVAGVAASAEAAAQAPGRDRGLRGAAGVTCRRSTSAGAASGRPGAQRLSRPRGTGKPNGSCRAAGLLPRRGTRAGAPQRTGAGGQRRETGAGS
jgi:hypothetical protein